ncbi:hypothetical protein [Mesorhizobium sp.]|uniref:hypothetical protein n=1 Tax=Mesorhizobium sp. TaxID=1871066 RepID=UPI000FEA6F5F|nr:hypothetical protein [Mesorhizobium sp.]RWN25251.1 MAG: hypothetical protein EOR95_29045 [Mesorhizobium sp.]
MRSVGFLVGFAMVCLPGIARSEQLFSYFSQGDDPLQATVTISPCQGEEVAECVSHSLSCSAASWIGPEFTIITGNVEKIAAALIVGTEGRAKALLKLAGGVTTVDLTIPSIHVDANEMDGGWSATLGIGNKDAFFDALTKKSSEGATFVVGGEIFLLAPQDGDGENLLKWKTACAAIHP